MFRDIKRVILLTLCLMVPAFSVFAASFGSSGYDSSLDTYVISVNADGASKLRVSGYKSGSDTPYYTQTYNAGGESGKLTINCNGSWKVELLDSSGSTLDSGQFSVTQIKEERGTCKEQKDAAPDSSGGSSAPSGGGSGCSDAVCECIGTLKGVNQGISDKMDESLGNQKKIKDAVDAVNDSTKAVKGAVDGLKDQFVSDKDYSFDDPPDYNLSDFKPDMPDTAFKDDTTYFKDNGDDSSDDMSKLPDAPEPKDWDGVTKEDELKKDSEKTKDTELEKDEFTKDEQLEKDKFSKDDELQKDKFNKDSEQKKDEELTKDQFQKDAEKSKDQELTKDQFKKDREKSKDTELSKDEFSKDSELRKDQFTQDEEMEKDYFRKNDEMQKDLEMLPDRQMQKDQELKKSDEMEKDYFRRWDVPQADEELTQTNQYHRTEFYDVTPEPDYGLRWKQ
ncbi:hypothetical protein MOF37_07575 [Bacillus spizizenii]|nr:hypothetical protein [Bacillus spizizenii]MCY8867414.1 hypothetical protein [Bacillus spizizenii]MCY9426175.1 hypothetical protein [Bacillus spizizenii]MCY9429228.1 hypothetical protein [Bacillus spizizenii]